MMCGKGGQLEESVTLMEQFCARNHLSVPRIVVVKPGDWRFPSTCAYYRADVVTICVERCAHIGRAGRAWSYPGYSVDRTPYGVIQHELGHHVDHMMSSIKGAYGGDFSVGMRAASREPKLTNYCPNDWEWFAEMFRLFATNPTFLQALRPKTYTLMVEAGLQPVETRHWREVLEHAPERTRDMAERRTA